MRLKAPSPRRPATPTLTVKKARAKGNPVTTASCVGRLAMLAVGLGIGAAVATTPGTASATTDIDISIDGVDIFNGGGSATAESAMGDMAIAIGPNSFAFAEGGFGDFASAFSTGTGAQALAGDDVPGVSGNDFDFASAVGTGSTGFAAAGNAVLPDTTGSSFDFASADGLDSVAVAGNNGSGDYASAVGDGVQSEAGFSTNAVVPANFDWASVWGNLFTPTSSATEADAGGGLFALGGSNDFAFILDPFGAIGSEAMAGLGNNFDLAGALGDDLSVASIVSDFISHIAPLF